MALGRGEVSIPNERWSLDFVHDTLQNARRIHALNIVDDFTREALEIEVDTSISGSRVARVIDRIADERGLSKTIVMDNGTNLTSLAMLLWTAAKRRVQLHYIAPGKPTQNRANRLGNCFAIFTILPNFTILSEIQQKW